MEKKITKEMFALPNAGEVILNLVKQGAKIDEEIQLKVFGLPDEKAAEIMLEYFKHHYLSNKAELKVFELPDEKAAEILLEYIKHDHYLCDKAQFKVFALPAEKAAEIMSEYIKHWVLCPKARKRYDELMAKSAKG